MSPAAARLAHWRDDPVQFVRDNFNVEPDAWQCDALRALAKGERVTRLCMKACAGPGKSAVLAWLGWWFLTCMGDKGEHPKGIAVSVTADNLKRNLWPELAKWQQRSPFLSAAFTHQAEIIFANDHPTTWRLDFASFAKTANADEQGRALSGLHSEFVFALIDESGDINPSVGRSAEQAMGGCKRGMIAQAGNPTSMAGLLYHSAVKEAIKWHVVTITADPLDPKRTPRVDLTFAQEQIDAYGRDNPWVMSFFLGLFPPGGFNNLLTSDQVERSMGRVLLPPQFEYAARVIGVDVARFGPDRTSIFKRQGNASWLPDILRGADTNVIAGRVAKLYGDWSADATFVDGTGGFGAGVIDQLKLGNLPVIDVQFAGSATDPKFFNKRTEIWWEMCEWVKTSGALPRMPELVRELTAPTYFFQGGKIRLEEKEQIKKRLGFSPDIADSLATTFAQPVKARPRGPDGQVMAKRRGQAVID